MEQQYLIFGYENRGGVCEGKWCNDLRGYIKDWYGEKLITSTITDLNELHKHIEDRLQKYGIFGPVECGDY